MRCDIFVSSDTNISQKNTNKSHMEEKDMKKKLEKVSQVKSYTAMLGVAGVCFSLMGIGHVLFVMDWIGRAVHLSMLAISAIVALLSIFILTKAKADIGDEATMEHVKESKVITLRRTKDLLGYLYVGLTVIESLSDISITFNAGYIMLIIGVIWLIQFGSFIYVEKRDANGIND